MWRTSSLVVLLLVLCTIPVRAQEVEIRAEVDRAHITMDDQIMLSIVVESRAQSVNEPRRPALADFEVYYRGHSQSIQIINGNFEASHIFNYMLVPKREGQLTIEPFVLEYRGKEYKSNPVRIRVGGQPPGDPGADEVNRNLYVVSRVDKETAYVNEQIIYTFYLYSALKVSNLNYTPPQFEGFFVEKLQEGEKQYHKIVNGRRYLVIEVNTAIFPTTSGSMRIEPGKLRLVELADRGFSFFDRGVERALRSRPVEIEVLPLPQKGRPASFDGAVGEDLTISAQLERNEIEEGEPVTMKVRVRGGGNVRTFSKPRLPELPQFKIYDADSKTEVRALDRVAGTRTYEIVLVPKGPGDVTIPPVQLSYFDTREARYRTIETKPMELTSVRTARSQQMADVPRRQQEIEVLGTDIAHIHTDVEVSDTRTPLYAHGLLTAVLPLPFLAVVLALVVQRRRDRLASNVALARASRARKVARKRLSEAARFLKAGKGQEFYAEISRALQQYVGDKMNISAVGLTHEGLRQHLADAGISQDERERLVQVLEHCDAARFAPGGFTAARMQDVLSEVESLVAGIEDGWNRRGARLAVVLLALSLGVSGTSAATVQENPGPGVTPSQEDQAPMSLQEEGSGDFVSPQALLRRGHEAYEDGRYEDAIDAYKRAEALGVRNGALYYNLGNAFFKNGSLGLAVANYRRAQMLSPRDRLLRSNLEYVLSKREDKEIRPIMPFPLSALRAMIMWFSLNEWLGLTIALYVLTCLLAIYRVLRRSQRALWRMLLSACAVMLLVSGGVFAYKLHEEQFVERAVISTARLSVMSGPGQDYTVEFWLHEGTEVEVEVTRSQWLRISVGGNLRGWVRSEGVVEI